MKRLLAIALISILAAMPFTAWANDSEATLEIGIVDDDGNPIDPDFPATIHGSVPNFDFGNIELSLVDEVSAEALGLNVSMVAVYAPHNLQVSIGEFTIAGYTTMRAFELDILVEDSIITSGGNVNANNIMLTAVNGPQTLFYANSANPSSLALATVDFDAELWAPPGSAYTVGSAQATLTWTIVPQV